MRPGRLYKQMCMQKLDHGDIGLHTNWCNNCSAVGCQAIVWHPEACTPVSESTKSCGVMLRYAFDVSLISALT